ncbi:MAG: M15 family metallopeptidase [Treponema sp.]|nr:M15 family metallopeptidase [Treponema sp.]
MPLFFWLIVLFASALGAPPPAAQEPGPELILRAYQHCYPEKAGEPVWRNGDWTITVGAETFYWAGGRLLPASRRDEPENWPPHLWAVYPGEVPSPQLYSPGYIETLRIQGSAEAGNGKDQHRAFQAALYGGRTRREIEALLVRMEFLGKRIVVHRDIADALKRVETSIREAAAGDRETAAFIDAAEQVGAYNWRQIRGSSRMSYHSWGLAVDILPKDTGDKGIYWLWERSRNDNWMILPLERRWTPPAQVIAAFENEGFTWGGKWPLYDTMHFEYRPELHEINRLLAAGGERAVTPSPAPAETGPDLHHLYPALDWK